MNPKPIFSLLLILFMLSVASSAGAEVTVSNVSAAQQPGTKNLEISYDVTSTETSTVSVSVSITDNGSAVTADSLSGDVGESVSTGTGKTIIWEAGTDWPEQVTSSLEVTVTADDGQGGGEPSGDFVYVGPGTDAGGNVTIDEPFYISTYEVTNEQMAAVMQWASDNSPVDASSSSVENVEGEPQELLDLDDSDCQISFSGETFSVDSGKEEYPCVEVTWYGAAAYCNYLSEQEGLTPAYGLADWTLNSNADGYRLPSEEQWEYAARGGQDGMDTEYSGSDSVDEVAWYWENSDADGNSDFYSGHGISDVAEKYQRYPRTEGQTTPIA